MKSSKKKRPCIRGLYRKRNKFVYQPPMKDGHRPPAVFLDTEDLSDAILRAEELRERETIRAIESETSDLIEEFLRSKANSKQHKGTATTATARGNLRRFVDRFPTIASISGPALEQWRDDLYKERKQIRDEDGNRITTEDPALSIASINSYLRYSQSFLSWLVRTNRIHESPLRRVRDFFPKRIPTKRGSALSKEERDRLLENCDHLELKVVLYFGFFAGLRRQEILNLRPAWILRDENGRPSHVRVSPESGADGTSPFTIKDDEERTIPLSDPLIDFLLEHRIDERDPYLVAPEIAAGEYKYRWEFKRRWKTYVTNQGLPDVTPHTLRHTFVSLLLSAPPEKRPSLLHLERWTGDNVETLKKSYAHLLEDRGLINAAN